MTMDNTVTLIGNVTRDPELRFMPTGAALASFGVAVNRRWKKGDDWEEEVHFFDVTCWLDLAENVTESITKGCRVVVTGRLQQRSWEAENGDKRSKVEIVADDVAPSLRWATAAVSRNERDGHSSGRQSGPQAGYSAAEEPF